MYKQINKINTWLMMNKHRKLGAMLITLTLLIGIFSINSIVYAAVTPSDPVGVVTLIPLSFLPYDIVLDSAGNMYLSNYDKHKVWKRDTAGNMTVFAGTGTEGYSGDGGPATSAKLNGPQGLALDSHGDLYIADAWNGSIRKVDMQTGIITRVAGNGTSVPVNDRDTVQPATDAQLCRPYGIAFDASDNMYFTDLNDCCIRKVDKDKNISKVAGIGPPADPSAGYSGDGGLAVNAQLFAPSNISVDSDGNIFFIDLENNAIRKINAGDSKISTVNHDDGYGCGLTGLKTDSHNNKFFSDTNNCKVWKLDPSNAATVVATTEELILCLETDAKDNLYFGITNGYNFLGILSYRPDVASSAATGITADSATLNGEVTDDNHYEISERGFVYSTTNATPEIGAAGVTKESVAGTLGVFNQKVIGLNPSTTYYFRAYATNKNGTSYGDILNFTTSAVVAPSTAPDAAHLSFNKTTGKFTVAAAAPTGTYKIYFAGNATADSTTVSHTSGSATESAAVAGNGGTANAGNTIEYTFTEAEKTESARTADGTVPAAATNPVLDVSVDNAVTIYWTASASAGTYKVYWGTGAALADVDTAAEIRTLAAGANATGNVATIAAPAVTTGSIAITADYYVNCVIEVVDANGNTSAELVGTAVQEHQVPPVAPSIITASQSNGTVGVAYSDYLAADGDKPITWSISAGSLPDGLSLNAETGYITGTPTKAGTFTFTVKATNAAGSNERELTTTIIDPDIPTVDAAKTAAEGASYSDMAQAAATDETVIADALKATAVTAINNGSVTVTINKVNYIAPVAGTADTPNGTNGSYVFTIKVEKGLQNQTTSQKTITITATAFTGLTNAQAVAAAKAAIVDGSVDVAYGADQTAKTAAVQSYVNGLLTGNAAGVQATVTYDSGNQYNVALSKGSVSDSKSLTMTVNEAAAPIAPSIITESQSNGTIGVAYSDYLVADGTQPITWSVSAGSLPSGLSLNADTGRITGTPTAAGTFTFTVKATNAAGSNERELTTTIIDPADIPIVDAAKSAAENATYSDMTQAAANSEAAIADALRATAVTAINNGDVTVTINKVSYNAPTAGDADNPSGTNGSYVFTVKVEKGSQNRTTSQKSITITATAFTGVTNADAVAAAKAALVDGIVSVAHGATQDQKTAAVQSYVNGLLTGDAAGVQAIVTYNNGTGKYDVALSKGSTSDSKSLTMTVNEAVATCTVTFSSDGSAYAAKTVTAGATIGNVNWPANPAKSGYIFNGWYTGANGTGTAFTSATTVTSTMTVYANWTLNSGGSGGGGGGGGGGGSSDKGGTSPAPAPASTYNANVSGTGAPTATLPVTVNTSAGSAVVNVGTQSGNIITGEGAAVITIPSIPGVNSYTLGIPADYLSTPGTKGNLTFSSDAGSMTLPSDMLAGMAGAAGKEAQITIGQGDKSNLPEAAQAAIGNHPLVQLTVTIDGKQTGWNNPAAPVTVSIPYTPTAAELKSPESIVVWYIDGSGHAVSVPNGHYDAATGTVTFTTTHFSKYAVGYNRISFNDVKASDWFSKAVGFIAARKITTGTGNGNYRPAARLTRGEFIVMLMRAYDIAPDTNPKDNFADAGNTYYTNYLAAAKRLGVSTGVGSNLFAPGKEITRQEMFTLLYNALKVIGQLPQGTAGKDLATFSDAAGIAPWAKDAMTLMAKTGTVGGSGGQLSPTATTTRAEMAQVLYNLLSV